MKADVDEPTGHEPARFRARHVVQAERHATRLEQFEDFIGIPTRLTKLERVTMTRRQRIEKCAKPLQIHRPVRRKLKQDRSKRPLQMARAIEEPCDRFVGILQLFHVREKAARFHGVLETAGRPPAPFLE